MQKDPVAHGPNIFPNWKKCQRKLESYGIVLNLAMISHLVSSALSYLTSENKKKTIHIKNYKNKNITQNSSGEAAAAADHLIKIWLHV